MWLFIWVSQHNRFISSKAFQCFYILFSCCVMRSSRDVCFSRIDVVSDILSYLDYGNWLFLGAVCRVFALGLRLQGDANNSSGHSKSPRVAATTYMNAFTSVKRTQLAFESGLDPRIWLARTDWSKYCIMCTAQPNTTADLMWAKRHGLPWCADLCTG
jgi:hypothetical protein